MQTEQYIDSSIEPSRATTETAMNAGVARAIVLIQELLQVTGEVRFLRASGLTRRDAAAALWSCRYARGQLDGAAHESITALDVVIGKLALIEIAGPP